MKKGVNAGSTYTTTPSGLKYSQHFILHKTSSMVNFKTEKKLHRPFLYIERVLSMYT